MQKALANQSKLRMGSFFLKLSSNQVTQTGSRAFSSVISKKENLTCKKSFEQFQNTNLKNINSRRSFSSTPSNLFWGKSKKVDEVAQVPVANEPQQSKPVEEIPQDQIDLTAYNQTGYIPEPPSIVDENIVLNALGEPALQQLGLASYYTPIGWVQNCIEYFHASLGMPWFASIALFAVCMRFCLFPITVKSQQNAAKMKKIAPLTNRLKEKLNEAKLSGDSLKVARASNEYTMLMKNNNIGISSFALPIAQFPVFISAFIGIKRMCNLPVESMSEGGIFWFQNLTVADPTYILPTLSVLSILAVVWRGIETGVEMKNMTPMMKMGIIGLSGISFPFLIFMPAGIMVYFFTTNLISLFLSLIMSGPKVKKALNIPVLTPNEEHEIKTSSKKGKNFLSDFQESLRNQKIINEVKERESLRIRQFEKAGTQVPQKTFKNNPKAK